MPPGIAEVAGALSAGTASAVSLLEAALARIEDPQGEGARAFLHVDREGARAMAEAADRLRRLGVVASPLAGLPVSVKDLFDVAGQPTRAGSRVLQDAPPAAADAPVVARLRAAGAVLVGRTNMTEFAFSGLGLNPHHGTPGNPHARDRIPGGSSSGAAVAVAEGMCVAALGSDTGGSVRIPAAFCGLAGFKPTQARVPLAGGVPLSWTLDTYGPIASRIGCCAAMDAVLAGEPEAPLPEIALRGLRFAVPRSLVLDDLDAPVAHAFSCALSRLSAAGALVAEVAFPAFDEVAKLSPAGGFPAAEAFAWHRPLLQRRGDDYDPRVRARIERGAAMSAADYIDLQRGRAQLIARADLDGAPYDALLMPTVAVVAPRFAALAEDAAYTRINALVLRNCSLCNILDRPAATVPCQARGELPVGLMLVGARMADRRLLALAAAVEAALRAAG